MKDIFSVLKSKMYHRYSRMFYSKCLIFAPHLRGSFGTLVCDDEAVERHRPRETTEASTLFAKYLPNIPEFESSASSQVL